MQAYHYKAYTGAGEHVEGTVEANSLKAALEDLHSRGISPYETLEVNGELTARWWEREVFVSGGLSRQRLADFTRELATLIGAELPVDQALRIMTWNARAKPLKALAQSVLDDVLGGSSVSEALASRPDVFPSFYCSVIRAGEASGTLGEVLTELAEFLERTLEVRAKIKSALMYPMILLVAAIAALVIILALFIPQIVPLFESTGASPPLLIALILSIQQHSVAYWPFGAGAAAGLAVLTFAAGSNERFKYLIDKAALGLPITGDLVSKSEAALFARTLCMQLRSGVSLIPALGTVTLVAKNRAVADALASVVEIMREGAALHDQLRQADVFPDVAVRLVAVGEETGRLEQMLRHIAVILEADVQRRLDRLLGLLAPALTLIIGIAVGGLIMSVMNAILSVNELAF